MHYGLLAAPMAALLLVGCGGAGKGSSTAQGRATLTLRWPSSRLVPFAANSIRLNVTRAGQGIGTALLVRPSGGGTSTATFDRLPVGAASVTATALPNADGSGVAQATASVPVTIVAGQTARVHLTMASTITGLGVTPAASSLGVGEQAQLIVTPRNAAGEAVLVTPSTLAYSTDAAAVARVDPFGQVIGVGPGEARVTVRETESGKTATVDVAVARFGSSLVENFDDGIRDASLWNVQTDGTGPSVAEVNGRLEITVPANSASGLVFDAGFQSRFVLRGDFDLQADFQLLTWPTQNGVRMGIWVGDGVIRDFMKAQRVSYTGTTQPLETVEATFKPHGGGAEDIGQVAHTALSGKLRIVRTAGVYSGYYWDAGAGQWVFIKSGHNFTGDMTVHLMAWSDDQNFGDKSVKVAFDNFIVHSGQVVP